MFPFVALTSFWQDTAVQIRNEDSLQKYLSDKYPWIKFIVEIVFNLWVCYHVNRIFSVKFKMVDASLAVVEYPEHCMWVLAFKLKKTSILLNNLRVESFSLTGKKKLISRNKKRPQHKFHGVWLSWAFFNWTNNMKS